MSLIKTTEEINKLAEGGKLLAKILKSVVAIVKPGVTGLELDKIAETMILQAGASPAFKNYHVYKFFNSEMKDAYAVADVVIARAGFGTISELASLSKVAILIPMSETHQEENVRALTKEKAVIVLDERTTEGVKLAQVVKDLISRPDVREYLGKRLHVVLPTASPEKIIEVIEMLVQAHH